jgi:hypothetical protein
MPPNKQVSPVIRISREERDASARATHLEAATRKFLVTTNERKYMSTKTNFKRIALVAVAALGLGALSSVPAQATYNADYLTVTAATASQKIGETYTSTVPTVVIGFLADTATTDSLSVKASLVSGPATSGSLPILRLIDTSNAFVDTAAAGGSAEGAGIAPNTAVLTSAVAAGQAYATYAVYLNASGASTTTAPTIAGTYVVRITPTTKLGVAPTTATYKDVTITVAALDNAATTLSTFFIQGTSGYAAGATTDSAVSALATASTTAKAQIQYVQKNASGVSLNSGSYIGESMTATITGAGTLGSGATTVASLGRSITVKNTDSISVFSDGTAGTGTIVIKGATSGTTLTTKTISFYSSTVSTITSGLVASVIGSSGAAVYGIAKDSLGNAIGTSTSVYAYSSDLTVISDSGTACAWVADDGVAYCTLTGLKDGTAKITLKKITAVSGGNSTEVAATPIDVRVSMQPIASVKLTLDKATYAPNEKATLKVTAYDAAGKIVPAAAYTGLFATGGISSSMALGSASDTLTAVSFSTAVSSTSTDPVKSYTIYMPSNGGSVTLTATGGAALPAAAQVKVTATATVTDSGAAALAAVAALATTVASLKTLITTLTNLVLKIQKKVKA